MLYNIRNSSEVIEKIKVEVLTGERSFILVFPKKLAVELGVGKGDFLKCHVDNNRLIVEKVKVNDEQEI
jgi:bifunctional DNA-binding transcriptional regulator/antitoxin component of YhaV-PrlF toxin-antitoxin module